ncbi:3D domain-containing protein [Mesobacillus zeae]|uniref:LysM peptidoglycan-binding domain-containing protein n=1 Tax=Mesobacillus zeae TaxID=1917180 RepID=A0A398B9T2_9BACI|nr:3D domain-containing protein [Mesobacillus zeae]RID85608.1 LysM peptidoglycan-binding domain-containing protein [Mesobacillus zeae]
MKKTVLSLVAAAAISGAAGAYVQAEEIVVHKGDTLWNLSQKYGVEVDSLKKSNNLSSDVIRPNDRLEISPVKTVIVNKGDTLWNIAKIYGVQVEDVMKWNKLSSDLIHPGEKLVIYTDTPPATETTADAPAPQNNAAPAPAPAPEHAAAAPVQAEPAQQPVKEEVKAANTNVITVSSTAYTANCEGCSGTTATGLDLKANPGSKVIAVDPSVIPLGSKVYVEGYGYATASDTGGAIKGNKIDVFFPSNDDAIAWGRKQVKVTVIE